MSVPNQEFFHFSSWGSSYDPTWYNHYDPAWLRGESKQTKEESKGDKDKEQVTELNVNRCCEGCVEKVYKRVKAMDGVANVHCDTAKNKVTVTGPAKPEAVLKEVKRISHLSGSTLYKKK
jgi:copper chaperone CopZ